MKTRMWPIHQGVFLAAILALAAGCASVSSRPLVDQQTSSGPTAEQMFKGRTVVQTGRDPSFEERMHFDNELEPRISRYLAQHPEVANSLDVSTFRVTHQVMVGMSKEQVEILLGPPDSTVKDAAEIDKLARRFAPAVKDKADEAWVYPLGWRFYFTGPKLMAITQYLPR